MKALWLTTPVVSMHATGVAPERRLLACPLASARLRTGVAAAEWSDCGNQNLFLAPDAALAWSEADWRAIQVCIVPKFTFDLPVEPWLKAIRAAKRSGCRLVVDVCDYPFGSKYQVLDQFYAEALKLADAVTVNSLRMVELLKQHHGKSISVIEDAVLGAMAGPAFAVSRRLKLLWFGHPSNLPFLKPWIGRLIEAAPRPCRLVIVTQGGYGVREAAREIHTRYAPSFELRFVEWSLKSTYRELAACDIAILPGNPADPVKGGASANRIAEVVNAGRFAVASPLQSYLPFRDAAWLGDDILEGIHWARTHPQEVLERIRRGQALVSERYAQHAIGGQWCKLFESVVNGGAA